ncbi:MAG: RNA pyrophosphohydrolase [Pseudomonadota bacterium]
MTLPPLTPPNHSDTYAHLPLRGCVGIVVFNNDGKVFIGKRVHSPEQATPHEFFWQMPQGGIDDGEDATTTAHRELFEETGITKAHILRIAPHTISYTFTDSMIENPHINKRYRGQEQTWVAMRFTGTDADINLNAQQPAEFVDYRWVDLAETIDLIVPFKRAVYEHVYGLFKDLQS